MALSDITQKILDDANKETQDLRDQTKKEILRIEADAEKELETLQEQQKKDIESAKQQAKQERISLYKQKIKNLIDGKKRTFLDDVFEQALEDMVAMSQSDHEAYMKDALNKLPKDLKGMQVEIAAKQESYLRKVVLGSFPKSDVIVSEDISAGCIVRGEGYEYNLTFNNLLHDKKKELEAEVAVLLFSDVKQ